jgi:hypothetical protein
MEINILFHISYVFTYYRQLLCIEFLFKKLHLNFLKFTFGIKIMLFIKSLLCQSMIDKVVHLQNKTLTYQLERNLFLDTYQVSTTIILDFRARRSIDP